MKIPPHSRPDACPEAGRGGHEADCCYCPKPATVHVTHDSGCCNACAAHAYRIRRIKGGVIFALLSAVGTEAKPEED